MYRILTSNKEEWLAVHRIRGERRTGFVMFVHSPGQKNEQYYFWGFGLQPDQKTLKKIAGTTPKIAADKFLKYFLKGGGRDAWYASNIHPRPRKSRMRVVSSLVSVDMRKLH